MTTRPRATVPIFASDDVYASPYDIGVDTKLEPSAAEISQGYAREYRAPARKENWLRYMTDRFVEHNDARLTRLPLHNVRAIYATGNDSSSTNYAIVWAPFNTSPVNGPRWLAYTDIGSDSQDAYYTQNGITWSSASIATTTALDGAFGNDVVVLATGTAFDGLVRSTTGGVTFTGCTVDDQDFRTVFFTGATFLASASPGIIRRSTDDGATFSAATTPPSYWGTSGYHASQFALGNGRVFAVPDSGARFIYSDDEGDTWSEVIVPNLSWRGVGYLNSIWYAVASTGEVYQSINSGVTWTLVTTTGIPSSTIQRQMFVHENLLCIVDLTGVIHYSTNGETWRSGATLHPGPAGAAFGVWSYGGGGFCAAFRVSGSETYLTTTVQADQFE